MRLRREARVPMGSGLVGDGPMWVGCTWCWYEMKSSSPATMSRVGQRARVVAFWEERTV